MPFCTDKFEGRVRIISAKTRNCIVQNILVYVLVCITLQISLSVMKFSIYFPQLNQQYGYIVESNISSCMGMALEKFTDTFVLPWW